MLLRCHDAHPLLLELRALLGHHLPRAQADAELLRQVLDLRVAIALAVHGALPRRDELQIEGDLRFARRGKLFLHDHLRLALQSQLLVHRVDLRVELRVLRGEAPPLRALLVALRAQLVTLPLRCLQRAALVL